MFRKICGESAFKNTVIVTNMWNDDSQEINEVRERGLSTKFFKPALNVGARMVRHENTVESSHNIIRRVMENNPAPLRIQQELAIEPKDIANTMAGKVISREFNEQIRRYQTELKEIRQEMERALKWKDEKMRRELAEDARKLEERMAEIARDEKRMSADYIVEKARIKAGQGAWKVVRDEVNVIDRARSRDLMATQTTIPFDEPAHHDASPRTRETGLSSLPRQSARSLSSSTSSQRSTSHLTSYVWTLLSLTSHNG